MNGRQINMILKRLWEIESRAVEMAKLIQPEIEPAIERGDLKLNLAMTSLIIIDIETNKILNIFKELDK
jgi:hypothetical protein